MNKATLIKRIIIITVSGTLLACASDDDTAKMESRSIELGHEKLLGQSFSYYADVKTIIDSHCTSCHQAGNIAPFNLTTYADVKRYGAAVRFAVENKSMPPWLPSPGYTAFNYDRSLSREERYLLLSWIDQGMPEGDPSEYDADAVVVNTDNRAEEFRAEGLQADVMLTLPEPYTPQPVSTYNGADDLRCFTVDWPLDHTVYLTSAGLIPDVTEQAHHAVVNVIDPQVADFYDGYEESDGQAGYSCFTEQPVDFDLADIDPEQILLFRDHPTRLILGWAPGTPIVRFPEGSGLRVEPGSKVLIQMHYNNISIAPAPDQSRVVFTVSDSVEREGSYGLVTDGNWVSTPDIPPIPILLPEGLDGSPGDMLIPAGESEVTHRTELGKTTTLVPELDFKNRTLYSTRQAIGLSEEEGYAIHSVGTHMHYLGSSSQVSILRSDGSEQMLQDIGEWDFDWQQPWWLAQEVNVGPEDKLVLSCSWDNSAANQQIVDGIALEPRDISWGDGSTTEMCLTAIYITKPVERHESSEASATYQSSAYIAQPQYGDQFKPGDSVSVRVNLNNFMLSTVGSGGAANKGYYKLWLDGESLSGRLSDVTTQIAIPENLAIGSHALGIVLYDEAGKDLNISDVIEIEIVTGT